ncbi:hypothetical protein EV187_2552 [Agromyces ramosus]|uniref:FtsX-like permease family protein n=1 Tax=Agromyces ramosus TaxID=33879 RepID=A0A4Q7MBT0_9MICO|nr:hypothetical protein [Agromyces ramosus]RZS64172.1 hypothetical protein EV187_2552 [Agromyces ramosus]
MGATRIAFARAAARAGVLGSIAAVVFLLAGLGTAVVDSLAGSSTSGLRDGLAAATGTDGAVRWQIRVARDPEAQADAAASVLDRMLVPHGVAWSRSVETAPVDARHGDDPLAAVLLADDGVPGRSELVSGSWPGDADALVAAAADDAMPATLHAGAATALGLAPGDVVELADGDGPRRLVVVGTWRPLDPNEPAWFGEPIVASGAIEGGVGPFVVGDEALVDLPAATVVRWTALVDPPAMTASVATQLRAALPNVEPALRAEEAIGTDGLGASGGLASTLDRLLAGLGAVRAITPLPVLLLAFSGFAALDRLAALLGASRRGETVLLRARGASPWRLAGDAAIEVVVVGIPAAAAGAVAATGLLALVRPGEERSWPVALLAASVALAGALLLTAGRTWRDATRPVVRGAGDEVGRMPRAALAGGVVVVAVAAAVSLWQFRLYGSPLVTGASGALEVDVVAVLAPVLLLLALSLAALGLTRPIGGLLERAAGRRPGLVPALPMRQLARRAGLYSSASFVAMLGVSGLTLTAVFAGSWQALDAEAAAIRTGGEVRVAYAGRDLVRGEDPDALVDPFAAVDDVSASVPVVRGEARIGSDPTTIVAVPAAELAGVAPGVGAAADATALAALAAAGESIAPALPPGAEAVTAAVRIEAPAGTPGTVAVSAWVLGAGGAASRLAAGDVDVASGGGITRAVLPDAPGLRLLGFEAALAGSQGAAPVTVEIGDVGVDGAGDAGAEPGGLAVTGTAELSATSPSGRIRTSGSPAEPVPVLLGAELAARIRAHPGDPLAFRLLTGGADVDAVVAGVVPAVPGVGDAGILADLGTLSGAAFDADAGVPATTEAWLASPEPERVAAALERDRTTALATSTRDDASSAPLIGPAVAALWAGAAGALLFALIAVVALVAALARTRFGEVVVLRALGTPARLQARARFAELAAALSAAAVIGILIGAVTAFATARELARASVAGTPGALPVAAHVAWLPWAAGLVAFLVLSATVGAVAAASVRREASRPGLREEER